VAAALKQPQKSTKHDEPCDPGDNKRSSDLCAQWKAADAAKSAAQANWWLGVVSSLIGAATLAAAWAAAIYAKKAAEETGRTADLAAATSFAELRPYLFIEKLVMERTDKLFRTEVIFKNFGKLPARSITVQSDGFFTMDPVELRKNVLTDKRVAIPVCAPSHQRRVFDYTLLNDEEIKALQAGFGYIVIRVRYRYKGGPRKRPYAERADYLYNARSIKTGHYYILSWEERQRATDERSLLFEFMDDGEEDWLDDDEEPDPDPKLRST
jgi:hypothetical protein